MTLIHDDYPQQPISTWRLRELLQHEKDNAALRVTNAELLAACQRALNEFSEWEGPEEAVDEAVEDAAAAHASNRARRAYAAIRAAVAHAEGRA